MNRTLAVILAGILSFSCSSMMGNGDSRELQLTGSPSLSSAQGTAKVSTTDDGNTQIDLEVKHLAPPEKVNTGATAFVVWVKDNNSETNPHNLGALRVDENLNGRMKAVTSLRSFDLYVTAEPNATTDQPSGEQLLRTNVEMKSLNEK
jgi:outer membrane PBP1 activator LpoA protein